MRNMTRKVMLCVAASFGILQAGGEAAADRAMPVLLSVRLLRSEAIVFATVSTLRSNRDHPDLIDVEFSDVAPVRSRWDLQASPLTKIRVQGELAMVGDTVQVSLGSTGKIRQGERYMLLLAGGSWSTRGPFTENGTSILEVRHNGYVGCGSGYLYGISQRAFVCGHPENYASEPMREATLRAALEKLIEQTLRARPNMERQLASSVRPLELFPRMAP